MNGVAEAIPKYAESVVGIASPKGKKAVANAYMHLAHGKEYVYGEPLLVPPGCVYVTFALCGQVGTDSHKILAAFEDPRIKDFLQNPVKYLKHLTAYFGNTLHVHYCEAEDPTSRTYYDTMYRPFLGYSVKGDTCFAKKSGLYRLGDLGTFKAPAVMRSAEINASSREYTAKINPCDAISSATLRYLYNGSLYPKLGQLENEFDAPPSFKDMKRVSKNYDYRQSWAFEMWPGVHYNFICRGSALTEKNINNSATRKRRRNSFSAAASLLSAAKGGSRRSRYTSS